MEIKSKSRKDETVIGSEEMYFDENGVCDVQDENLAEAMIKDFPGEYSKVDGEKPKPVAKASTSEAGADTKDAPKPKASATKEDAKK